MVRRHTGEPLTLTNNTVSMPNLPIERVPPSCAEVKVTPCPEHVHLAKREGPDRRAQQHASAGNGEGGLSGLHGGEGGGHGRSCGAEMSLWETI